MRRYVWPILWTLLGARSPTILSLALLVFPATACAQAGAEPKEEAPKTKLEAFQARTGLVIIRGFEQVGTLSGQYGSSVEVEAKEFADATTGKKEYGITVEVKGSKDREHTSYIDYDEIESLLRGIDYIAKIDKNVTKLSNFQADYRTKGELKISTFNNSSSEVMFAVEGGDIYSATAFFQIGDLPQLRNTIATAKQRLDAVRTTIGK
jgi:hypothetical protein